MTPKLDSDECGLLQVIMRLCSQIIRNCLWRFVRVRAWLAQRPSWLQTRAPQRSLAELTAHLGTGEREAMALAEELVADAVLLDDWTARLEALRRHLTVLGTLRVLANAAENGFANLRVALDRLQQTNFRARPELIEALLKWDAQRKHK